MQYLVDAAAVLFSKPNQLAISSLKELENIVPHIAVTSVERRDKTGGLFAKGNFDEGLPFNHGGLDGFKLL